MAGKPRSPELVSKPLQEWAFLVWPYLIAVAKNRQTITYGDLASILNWGGASRTGLLLGYIYDYCGEQNYPHLPVIVVNQKTGLPSDEAPYELDGIDVLQEREKVYRTNWYGKPLPTPSDFLNATKNARKQRDPHE